MNGFIPIIAHVERYKATRNDIGFLTELRIPVSMHNVPEKDIYRPAAWNAFGMEKEGADFRACKNYGPLYK